MTAFVADACAIIDFFTGNEAMGPTARRVIEDERSEIAVLATTVWEIAIKTAAGRLPEMVPPGQTLTAFLTRVGIRSVALTSRTAEAAAALPLHHRDPFDRALIAYALETRSTVLTSDAVFGRYGAAVVW
ncbi:type II toxin-antitoxin system VapC family toxin [Marinivivus vitaminiproducens]|uniref:type II toxin-antitoxin system VapC family toxin n=1 Tax=Marinivivus vitaminiproducens TaxID=3035935 RepID=UPI00279A7D8B|nr:type II toxin-antitoxin system VapC family toxin [Geminicoccaceae bacterium SCSIO 64248]